MRSSPRSIRIVLFAALFAVCRIFPAGAGERCDIAYMNGLDETIVGVRVKYSTPYDEPRHDRSRINLAPGGMYRIGAQGTIMPELMILEFATKQYVFRDLSKIVPADLIFLSIESKDGKPHLRQNDSDQKPIGEAEGAQQEFLTAANRPNAIDKDSAMDVADYDELMTLIREKIDEATTKEGALEDFDVEAGPIWNHENALERCPEVVREWSEKYGKDARWTGHWRTTVPGEMSVCGCVAGAADEAGTVVVEDEGWGRRTSFPVFWMEWFGVGTVSENHADGDGLPVAMRFAISREKPLEMLEELLSDVRVDGFSPLRFAVEARDGDDAFLDEEIDFSEGDMDKWDAHDRIMELLSEGRKGAKLEATVVWVEDEALERIRAGEDVDKTRGVACSLTKETLDVVFIPDGTELF